MTTFARPEDYEDELPPLAAVLADPAAAALNRLTAAVELLAHTMQSQTIAQTTPTPMAPRPLAALPPVVPQVPQVQAGAVCPIHNQPWRLVPGGISKKTGKPYDAFYACQVQGCDQRPPR